jgi:hypothetical protein
MNDPTAGGPADAGAGQGPEPTEEEMRAALEEQMRNIRAGDVILQTTATLINLGARRLGLATEPGTEPSGEIDLGDAKLAIDGARALAPLCPAEQAEPIKQALSQLQMAYAQRTGGGAPPEEPQPAGGEPPADEAAGQDAAEREQARSKLWTPPGT